MLTKTDLNQIRLVVREEVTDEVKNQLKKTLEPIKKDVAQTRKDVKVLIAYFDREYVELRKRIDRIEDHLGLDTKN